MTLVASPKDFSSYPEEQEVRLATLQIIFFLVLLRLLFLLNLFLFFLAFFFLAFFFLAPLLILLFLKLFFYSFFSLTIKSGSCSFIQSQFFPKIRRFPCAKKDGYAIKQLWGSEPEVAQCGKI